MTPETRPPTRREAPTLKAFLSVRPMRHYLDGVEVSHTMFDMDCQFCRGELDAILASASLLRDEGEPLDLLRRIRGWDQLPETNDGPYWMREIDHVLGASPRSPVTPTPEEDGKDLGANGQTYTDPPGRATASENGR